MIAQPTLATQRLRLRPLEPGDAAIIQNAAGARQIADTMISLPHPYPVGEAERYVAKQRVEQEVGHSVTFTVEQKAEGSFCGLVEVRKIEREHSQSELSFWLAVDAWGHGYMIEDLQVVVQYGFEDLDLNRLYAYHMLRNPASGRILERNRFKQEGLLRQRVRKWGKFEDVALWAILRQDWRCLLQNEIVVAEVE